MQQPAYWGSGYRPLGTPYPGGGGAGAGGGGGVNFNVARLFAAAANNDQMQRASGKLTPASLLGAWADSLGNAVHVFSTDAYEMRLMATLTRPPRPDIHLCLRPCESGGGWQCGNSILDPLWTSEKQLHWVTFDGRVSVWVRLHDEHKTKSDAKEGPPQEGGEDGTTPALESAPKAEEEEAPREAEPEAAPASAQPQEGTEQDASA